LSVTYLYCLVRSSRKPALRRVTGGLPGAGPVRALDAGNGVWLVAADVNEAEYDEGAIAAGLQNLEWVSARAVGHEGVIEQFLSGPAVLPMQLFTIFKTDARALEYVTRNRRKIDGILKRIGGHVEWGVRLTWDEQAARAAVEDAHGPRRATGGAAYLARKKDLRDVNRAQLAGARAEATRVFKDLSRHATDAVRRTSTEQAAPGSRLLLDAAYLVPAKSGAAFKTALRKRTRDLQASGLAVSVTGPWPAYNFIA
jgi:Gas vesicle synthesis protein GvpL/GvpF